jgi:hypothetical protein
MAERDPDVLQSGHARFVRENVISISFAETEVDRLASRKLRPLVGVKRSYLKTTKFLSGKLRPLVGELHFMMHGLAEFR